MTASSRPSGCAGSSVNGLASPPTRSTADIARPQPPEGAVRASGGVPDGTQLYRLLTQPCPPLTPPWAAAGHPRLVETFKRQEEHHAQDTHTHSRSRPLRDPGRRRGGFSGRRRPGRNDRHGDRHRRAHQHGRGQPRPPGRDDDDAAEREDISGPCDEAEHANDPRCGGQAPASRRQPGQDDAPRGVDISGPGSPTGPRQLHPARRPADDDRVARSRSATTTAAAASRQPVTTTAVAVTRGRRRPRRQQRSRRRWQQRPRRRWRRRHQQARRPAYPSNPWRAGAPS